MPEIQIVRYSSWSQQSSLKIMSDLMFATQMLLWLASQLMKPSQCYLSVLSLRNEYLIIVCETYKSGWARLTIQWHFCTLTEPITWSVGYGDKFWLLFLLNFRFITLHHHHHVLVTRVSPEPRGGIMTMKKPSTNADNCRKYRHRLEVEDSLLE